MSRLRRHPGHGRSQGIEIDYCPQCRGVWLDRGELDKIIERTASLAPQVGASPPLRPAPQPEAQYRHKEGERYREDQYRHKDDGHYRHKKKESLLGELFEF